MKTYRTYTSSHIHIHNPQLRDIQRFPQVLLCNVTWEVTNGSNKLDTNLYTKESVAAFTSVGFKPFLLFCFPPIFLSLSIFLYIDCSRTFATCFCDDTGRSSLCSIDWESRRETRPLCFAVHLERTAEPVLCLPMRMRVCCVAIKLNSIDGTEEMLGLSCLCVLALCMWRAWMRLSRVRRGFEVLVFGGWVTSVCLCASGHESHFWLQMGFPETQ